MTPQEKLRSNLPNREPVLAEDVVKLFSLSLEATEAIKTKLESAIESTKGEASTKLQGVLDQFNKLETSLESLGEKLSNVENKLSEETKNSIQTIFDEMQQIKSSIPVIPTIPNIDPLETRLAEVERKLLIPNIDLSPLEAKITELESRTIPEVKEVTAEEVRNKLETLQGEEKLDASAIKNLPQGVTVSVYPPEDPVENQLWVKI